MGFGEGLAMIPGVFARPMTYGGHKEEVATLRAFRRRRPPPRVLREQPGSTPTPGPDSTSSVVMRIIRITIRTYEALCRFYA